MTVTEFDQRLALAYGAAMKATHDAARVEFHLSRDVVDALSLRLKHHSSYEGLTPTAWGWPVVIAPGEGRIEVHAVTAIL